MCALPHPWLPDAEKAGDRILGAFKSQGCKSDLKQTGVKDSGLRHERIIKPSAINQFRACIKVRDKHEFYKACRWIGFYLQTPQPSSSLSLFGLLWFCWRQTLISKSARENRCRRASSLGLERPVDVHVLLQTAGALQSLL